jgi:hypothetical protein
MPSNVTISLPSLLLFVLSLSQFTTAQADDLKLMLDPKLDHMMVEWSSHRDSGQAALLTQIEKIEDQEGAFAPTLYGYLSELSRIKQANNQHEEAIDLYQRMQTLTHWAYGIDSPLQMEAIKLQSRSRRALGQFVNADRLERFHLWIAEKNFEGEALVPSLWRLADWQRTTLQYRKAMDNYDRTLEVVRTNNLPSVYEVRTLEAKALTEHLARRSSAADSLEQAFESRMSSNFSDYHANQNAKLNLADMQTLYSKKAAREIYAELADLPAALLGPQSQNAYISALDAANNPVQANTRVDVLYPEKAQTFKLDRDKPKPRTASIGEPVRLCSANVAPEGFVDVSLQVSAQGKPQNLEIVGTVPRQTKRHLRAVLLESRYRPAFENGEAIAQTIEFRQFFDRTRPLQTDQVARWRDILAEHACQFVAMR